ncbi:MAG TPA: CehA/McbA family metallohydrolase [Tepidisphaeraceae bacterium]|nr:CehA/McbA family metallohydrolase [Tepidisphaeraceae bacterium]
MTMNHRTPLGLILLLLLWATFTPSAFAAPEAFEVGPEMKEQLPGGKEADGIIGDFILRNDKVTAVISHNAPLRRANMSTFYGATGITPGCLYDLTLRGRENDQITIFSPASQQGAVSYVRIAGDGRDGDAVIETVVTAANNNGVYRRHEYRLRDGWQGVLVVTTLRNEGKQPATVRAADRWTVFRETGTAPGEVAWADAIDPADKAGYAYAPVEVAGPKAAKAQPLDVTVGPGRELVFARFLAVGRSPAEAAGVAASVRGETGVVAGRITDPSGTPVTTAKLNVLVGDKPLPAYPDERGEFSFRLPPGEYGVEAVDVGRDRARRTIEVRAGDEVGLDVQMSAASAVEFVVRTPWGGDSPCKVQFIGINGTKSPDLGPRDRAHGCLDQYHSGKGRFRVQVPPGDYRVVVTRGIEHDHVARDIKLAPGQTVKVEAVLVRSVDTPDWVATDFHNHSTQSGDNTCGTDDRIINLAAEHIEFAPTTEHNRLYDWRPHIERLGLAKVMNTVSGLELTGEGPHLNSFPFEPVPYTQDRGAPVWRRDPRLNAITLRDHQGANPDRWIQINHPDMVENFIDRDGDGKADGGYVHVGQFIDGLETQNGPSTGVLGGAPFRVGRNSQTRQEEVQYVREFIWLQLLNRGHRLWGLAVSDAHSVHGNGVGGWRTYIPSSTDDPAKIDWKEMSRNAKAGKMILSNGPYLEVQTTDGVGAGGATTARGSIDLKVRVQCPSWIDIDRVQVLVNGREREDVNFTRRSHPDHFRSEGAVKFERTINVPLKEDAHLIVVACGEDSDLSIGYGSSGQARMRPCAYNNPIFVDVDGNGFTPNGDTLGYDLPVKKLTVEEVRRQLTR